MQAIDMIAAKTGQPKSKILQGFLVLAVSFVILGIGSSIITNVVGIFYPAFMSFVALESEGKDDDKLWLTYWTVFGVFHIVDQFAGFILAFVPFYYVLKIGFLIWMFHPATQGAIVMYDNFVLPYFKKYEGDIINFQKEASSQLKKGID